MIIIMSIMSTYDTPAEPIIKKVQWLLGLTYCDCIRCIIL